MPRRSPTQLDAWMHGVNSVRLVLGTILDVGEGDELPDATAPDAQQRVLYYILGYLLEQIVDVLFSTVPVEGSEDDPVTSAPFASAPQRAR